MTILLDIVLKVYISDPALFMVSDKYIVTPICGRQSGLNFGFPIQSLCLQSAFDWSMFLTIFYTGKNSNLSKEEVERYKHGRASIANHLPSEGSISRLSFNYSQNMSAHDKKLMKAQLQK